MEENNIEENKQGKKKNKKILKILVMLIIIAVIITLVTVTISDIIKPSLVLTSPKYVSISEGKEFTVSVELTSMPDEEYPAASISLDFDNDRMEFLRVEQGTLGVGKGDKFEIPTWAFNAQRSNSIGSVNAMYMDVTTKDKAYIKDNFEENKENIVIKYVFKLKSSAREGDKYKFHISDAVFAKVGGSEDKKSLATSEDKLNTDDCTIEVVK